MNRDSQRGGNTKQPRSPVSIPLPIVLAGFALLLAALASGLRADSFFAGDPGVKLIAAREAIAHPARPLEVDVPAVAGTPLPYTPPFFAAHGDHAHAITSPLFPLVSAPLLAAFGLRGAYILPGLGFLLALAAAATIARTLDARQSPVTAAMTVGLGTPLVFYALELWEHAPAVGAGTAALALFLRRRHLVAGMLFGVAVLLRPEAVWFGVAVLVASPLLPSRPTLRDLVTALVGTALTVAPLEIYTLAHFGTLVPLHVGSNVGDLDVGWTAIRSALISLWFLGASSASFWRVGPVFLVAVVSLALTRRSAGGAFLWAVAVTDIVLVTLTAPNDGGGQWGPRYLLFAYVPLAILAADVLTTLSARTRGGWGVAIVALIAAVLIQREGYRSLRGTKATYGRIVDLVQTEAAPGTPVVTDLWWLDQIAAAATAGRPVLYAGNDSTGRDIMRRLTELGVPGVTVVRSAAESPDTTAWSDGTCFAMKSRTRLSVRELVAIRLERRCP